MQKTSRSRCSTKSQDGTAERGSALFVVALAQMDRATAFKAVGRRFESCMLRQYHVASVVNP